MVGVAVGVVSSKRIAAKIVGQIAPNGMDVITVSLGTVVLCQQVPALNSEVVRLAGLKPTGPHEMQLIEPLTGELLGLSVSKIVVDDGDI